MFLGSQSDWSKYLPISNNKKNIKIGVFSHGVWKNRLIQKYFNNAELIMAPANSESKDIDYVIGWGQKPTSIRGKAFSKRHSIPFLTIEDGWIHSFGKEKYAAHPLSLVIDDLGIYYDARVPSRLEGLIQNLNLTESERDRAQRLRSKILELGVSKYNRCFTGKTFPINHKVLVVDQTYGDLSIRGALVDDSAFQKMLAYVQEQHPESDIYIKMHPEVVSGKKKGHFDIGNLPDRVRIIDFSVNPIELLKHFDHVHVVSSQFGFEALMLGIPVTCHGVPFYAGWGLTKDLISTPRRSQRRDIDELFYAAYLLYANYINPVSGDLCSLEELLQYLKRQIEINKINAGKHFCIGFKYWKRYIARSYLSSTDGEVFFCNTLEEAERKGLKSGDSVVIWANRETEQLRSYCEGKSIRFRRMEDGYLRSVGLGSDFYPPCSLVLDNNGIYYRPESNSDLFALLSNGVFDTDILLRAESLRNSLVENRLSKYNLDSESLINIPETTKKKILVPGQVEDDASVKYGGGGAQNNLTLLQTVREENPNAFILFKPHPDVVSGNRRALTKSHLLESICDIYVSDINITDCIDWADEIHTLTSLTGFEAILRYKKVVVYGSPFYSGWGITEDRVALPNRGRRRSVQEMIAAVLLSYPEYYDWDSRSFITAEQLVDKLKSTAMSGKNGISANVFWCNHIVLKGRQLLNVFRYA